MMTKRFLQEKGVTIAVLDSDGVLINDSSSALDLMADLRYNDQCDRMIMPKNAVGEGFFTLSTGIAGEILQKFINYRVKIAIVGDFSIYTSKPLHDFIYECNRGNDIFFVADEETAIQKLTEAV